MTPAPVHLELLRDYNQLLPAPGERVTRIITCGFGGGDKFSRGCVDWVCRLLAASPNNPTLKRWVTARKSAPRPNVYSAL